MTVRRFARHRLPKNAVVSTVVIVDESELVSIAALTSALVGLRGPVAVLVTRHRPPSPVFASSAGIEGPIMWTECHAEHGRRVEQTNRRVRDLTRSLDEMGLGPVTVIDCLPTDRLLRSRSRRQADAVVRSLTACGAKNVVIDPGHERYSSLTATLTPRVHVV